MLEVTRAVNESRNGAVCTCPVPRVLGNNNPTWAGSLLPNSPVVSQGSDLGRILAAKRARHAANGRFVGMEGRWVRVVVVSVLLGTACTSGDSTPGSATATNAARTSSGITESTPTASTSPTGQPTSQPPPPTTSTEPPGATEPLVLAVHLSRGALDISELLARRLVGGGQVSWSELDGGRGRVDVRRGASALTRVQTRPGVVAVVPGSEITPLVRAVLVDGADPLREPERYPLQTPAVEEVPAVVELTVSGDIMLGRGVAPDPGAADPAPSLRPLQRRLARADITVGNLESTLSNAGVPRQGDDSFAADPAVVARLADAGFDVLSLANNHTGDYGDAALRQTLRELRDSPIESVGAGEDARRAWRPVLVERSGVRFGFVAFNAIGETPIAGPGQPGAASVRMQPRTGPLNQGDLRRLRRTVDALTDRVDVVIVLPHWGDQYTNQPVPAQRRVGRAILRSGADLVVGGHPHWVQGVQVHDDRLVVHSLGNFIFDMDFSRQTQEGVLLDLVFWGDELRAATFAPYVIGPDFAPRPVRGERAEAILGLLAAASDPPFSGL